MSELLKNTYREEYIIINNKKYNITNTSSTIVFSIYVDKKAVNIEFNKNLELICIFNLKTMRNLKAKKWLELAKEIKEYYCKIEQENKEDINKEDINDDEYIEVLQNMKIDEKELYNRFKNSDYCYVHEECINKYKLCITCESDDAIWIKISRGNINRIELVPIYLLLENNYLYENIEEIFKCVIEDTIKEEVKEENNNLNYIELINSIERTQELDDKLCTQEFYNCYRKYIVDKLYKSNIYEFSLHVEHIKDSIYKIYVNSYNRSVYFNWSFNNNCKVDLRKKNID